MATRSPEEIRASIEKNRSELAVSIGQLKGEVAELTSWRRQLARHRAPVVVGAAVAGFLVGGGIAAVSGLFGRR